MNDSHHSASDVTPSTQAFRIEQSLEAERRRIAALLDSQIVASLNLLLSQAVLYEQTMQSNPHAYTAVSVLSSLIRQSLQKARDLQANLHPTLLDALGLEPALDALMSQHSRMTGLRCQLDVQRLRERLPVTVELTLFRAAQDLLDRAVTTVFASQASIQLARLEHQVVFVYSDNGAWHNDLNALSALIYRLQDAGGKAYTDLSGDSENSGGRITIEFVVEPTVELTTREIDMVRLLAEGLSNKEIAARLSVSPRTVNFHLDNLYSKLGVNNRTEAVMAALRYGLVEIPVK